MQVQQAAPTVAPAFELSTGDEDLGHLVCCRDTPWRRALCGAEESTIALSAARICPACLDEVETMRPGWRLEAEGVCVVDGRRCPEELELLDIVARHVLPD